MENCLKKQIYKAIIGYLLESTDYELRHIADLSNASEKNIYSIYYDDFIPPNFKSELQLVKLFSIILDIHHKQNTPIDIFQNSFTKPKTKLIAI